MTLIKKLELYFKIMEQEVIKCYWRFAYMKLYDSHGEPENLPEVYIKTSDIEAKYKKMFWRLYYKVY